MEKSPHVFLSREGADLFSSSRGSNRPLHPGSRPASGAASSRSCAPVRDPSISTRISNMAGSARRARPRRPCRRRDLDRLGPPASAGSGSAICRSSGRRRAGRRLLRLRRVRDWRRRIFHPGRRRPCDQRRLRIGHEACAGSGRRSRRTSPRSAAAAASSLAPPAGDGVSSFSAPGMIVVPPPRPAGWSPFMETNPHDPPPAPCPAHPARPLARLSCWEYGHETVARIAYLNVSPRTRAEIDRLLRACRRLLDTPTCPARTIARRASGRHQDAWRS